MQVDFGKCKSTVSAWRPPLLAAVLDITKETEDIDKEMFTKFLEIANATQRQAYESRISINGSLQYSISTKNLEQEMTSKEAECSSGTNSSLLDIFQYYAALEPPNALQAKTFSDVLETNDTMELVEFHTFLRDFQVVPRLLSKKEVREVWNSICADYVAAGHGTFKKMDFEVFRDAIIRLAVCAFCKNGLRNMMTKVHGFSLNARHAVDYFCKYLHLEDVHWVKRHINIVGKESQGARNYRSHGEVDEQAMAHLAEDREVARLLHKGKMSAETKRKKKKSLLKKVVHKPFAGSAGDSVHTSPSKSLLPEGLKQQMYPEFFTQQMHGLPTGEDDADVDIQRSIMEDSQANSIEDSQTMLTMQSTSADCTSKILKLYYDQGLVKFLSRYCVGQEHQITTRYIYSEGGFVDMGIVPVGAKCQIRFFVTNKSRDGLFFDVMARDLDCEDVCVKTHAAMLIPGLQRVVDISFTISRGHKSVIGFVDLVYMGAGSAVHTVISCPIYFRVGLPASSARNICTIHTIDSLSRQYPPDGSQKARPSHLLCTLPQPTSRNGSTLNSARRNSSAPVSSRNTFLIDSIMPVTGVVAAGGGGAAAMALRATKDTIS
jgi:hypothetical protein